MIHNLNFLTQEKILEISQKFQTPIFITSWNKGDYIKIISVLWK